MTTVLTSEPASAPHERTPIDEWLRRQQDLTAVERFSARHDELEAHGLVAPRGRWRERLPAGAPGPGQQYAFDVDLDSCTGCKACVAACHNLNGLDDGEAWRRVGSLHDASGSAGTAGRTVTVTSACHHCVDPACMNGCPARAYDKDPVTGIVRHLDDACIGCSYCTLTCPYEVPVFNRSLGIVRKCDLCSDRLAVGEAPACVQGCPQGAITITLASVAELTVAARGRSGAAAAALVPTAPPSGLTVPSTSYRSAAPVPDTLVAADRSSIHPSHGHRPLAVMLVLTQAAVGMVVTAALLGATDAGPGTGTGALPTVGLATGLVALAASTLHLGRPSLAWRALLGLRRSWLSREIAAFGLFAGAGMAAAVFRVGGADAALVSAAETGAVVGGIAGVACSVRLYAVTGRRWWRTRTTALRFLGTTLATGSLATAAVIALAAPRAAGPVLDPLLLAGIVGLLTSVVAPLCPLVFAGAASRRDGQLDGTARLLRHQLRARLHLRLGLAVIGVLVAGAARSSASATATGGLRCGLVLAAATGAVLLGEYQDRRLFFLASVAPRMPGAPR